ncbi:MAG TPA: hypothetical protein VIA11_11990 [Acidimicrobiia bacterium]|jgi:hypothetical protein|nr:hypothetical protein [Acidimicrobiia bacterium]
MAGGNGSTVSAGPITFVVQHRALVQDGVESGGPTVRVLGGDDEHEYLRFDLFNVSPHYHYEPPAEQERILMIDTVAEGDVVSWGVTRLRDRLVPMLVAAGGQGLADALDEQVLARAVDDVESLVRNPPAPAPDA